MTTTIQPAVDVVLYIPLEKIVYNRYQPRKTMDAGELEKLAGSILQNTMLQKPTARPQADGCYELAFGHRRFEAYKLLAAQQGSAFSAMPLIIRELTDEQMFDLAWDENEERADLNPIDEGKAYETWMREFGKTSKEAGLRFHTSEENIRAKIRLGTLPELAKEKVRNGELNETAARSLLTITRLFPGNEFPLKQAIEEIQVQGEKPEAALASVLRTEGRAKIIGSESDGHFSMKAKTFKYLPELTRKAAMEALDYENNEWVRHAFAGYGVDIPEAIGYFKTNIHYLAAHDQPELLIEKLNHLINPPACTACQFFAQVDGTGYCAMPACFDRKKEAAEEDELHKVSEKTGIAVYTEADGVAKELNRWNDKHHNAFNKKHADLRLRKSTRYNTWEGIPSYFAVVAVGNLFKTWKKADEQTKAFNDARNSDSGSRVDYERQRAIRQIRDSQTSLFAWEFAAPLFATVLDGVTQIDVLMRIEDEMMTGDVLDQPKVDLDEKSLNKLSKPARLSLLRKVIVYKMLDSRMDFNTSKKITDSKAQVSAFAKHLQGLATAWGVKLPKDFEAQAQTYDEAIKLAVAELDQSKAAK